jgi:Trk-type K+ transport system membrane component
VLRLGPKHPAQVIVLGFVGAIVAGTGVLMLPMAKQGEGGAGFLEALFTATSSVCVTGLIVVDTPTFWTPFGQAVIMVLIQLGGFGVMSFGALLGVLLAGRLGLKSRISAAAETKSAGFGDVRTVLLGVLRFSLLTEAALASILMLRFIIGYGYSPGRALWEGVFHAVSSFNNAGFALYSDNLMGFAGDPWVCLPIAAAVIIGYGYSPGRALWEGVFHAVSSFNNAGFALYSDNLMGFAGDPWVCLPIAAAVIIGGMGFPVLMELSRRYRRPIHWSMNTKLVLSGTAVLLVLGTVFITAVEWGNRATLGSLPPGERILAGFFQSVISRTAGFNSVDIAELHPVTWMGMDILMFIGGGPAGTAGGLKITTFAVLFFILYAEIRGGTAVNIFGKRLSGSVHREAITVVLLAIALVVVATMALMFLTRFGQEQLLFEVVSAFGTVGLSTGITAALPPAGQVILIALMFIGRLGPVTLASALALRQRPILYEYPEERPLIG